LKIFLFELIYYFKYDLKIIFAECVKKTLGKELLCRVSKQGTRQRASLPSVLKKALGKELLYRVSKKGARQRPALGKEALCRVPEKKTLGKIFDTRQRSFFR
jgi:hypothetical protein